MRATYFCHVPKTGGTALTRLLGEQLPLGAMAPSPPLFDWSRHTDFTPLAAFRCYIGHRNFLDQVTDGRFVFTVLRHPVERLLSNWNDWRRLSDASITGGGGDAEFKRLRLASRSWPLDEFLAIDHPGFRYCFDNGQARFLLPNRTPSHLEAAVSLSGEALLQAARASLARMQFVGIAEFDHANALLLAARLGLRPARAAVRHNVARTEGAWRDQAAWSPRLARCVAQDLVLYREALSRFATDIDSLAAVPGGHTA